MSLWQIIKTALRKKPVDPVDPQTDRLDTSSRPVEPPSPIPLEQGRRARSPSSTSVEQSSSTATDNVDAGNKTRKTTRQVPRKREGGDD